MAYTVAQTLRFTSRSRGITRLGAGLGLKEVEHEPCVSEGDFVAVVQFGFLDLLEVLPQQERSVGGSHIGQLPDAVFAADLGVLTGNVRAFGKRAEVDVDRADRRVE